MIYLDVVYLARVLNQEIVNTLREDLNSRVSEEEFVRKRKVLKLNACQAEYEN